MIPTDERSRCGPVLSRPVSIAGSELIAAATSHTDDTAT
jgi:hypothetical protein